MQVVFTSLFATTQACSLVNPSVILLKYGCDHILSKLQNSVNLSIATHELCMDFNTGVQFLSRAVFISVSSLSNHLCYPPSFVTKWYQEVFPWIARGWNQPLALNYCLGPECVWKFTPIPSLCFCDVMLTLRDNLYSTVIELFFVLYWSHREKSYG